ncbi:MAG TPA: universal stress protein [Actinomycetales bacterium]|nr:universal stress protein [Actinomycetales bacterium]
MSTTQHDRLRVVVGYDGSPGSARAVEWAAEQCNLRHLPLEVRSVVEPVGPVAVDLLDDDWAEEDQDVADRLAREGAEIAAGSCRFQVLTRGVVGHPVAALVDGSDSAALLVVGAQGAVWQPSRVLGSVAFAVTVHADCPVAVVHGAPPRQLGPRNPVVVGVDGSRSASAALLQGTDLAARSGAELVVVSTWRSGRRRAGAAAASSRGGRPDPEAAAQAVALAEVERAHLVRPEVAASTRVIEGSPAAVLAELSADAGVVVVGSRGHGGFAGMLLGSVTRRLVHEARCPVVVTRRVQQEQEHELPALATAALRPQEP